MTRLRVCFFIPGFAGGGAQKQCIYLMNELQRREDVHVSLVHFYEGVNFGLLCHDGLEVRQLNVRSLYSPLTVLESFKAIRNLRPDLLFSWLQSCDVYSWGIRKLLRDTKWVMAERDSTYPSDPRFWLRGLLGRGADLIAANSSSGARYWERRGVPRRRRLVVNNILPAEWSAHPKGVEKQIDVCYGGRLEPQKNVLRVADAFASLARARSDLKLVMIGEGSQRGAVSARLGLGQSKSVPQLLPFQESIRSYFVQSRVFVNMSHHEGAPNTVIENIALGNRVVLSRIPEHIELVGEGYRYLVDKDCAVEDLVEQIGCAVNDPVRPGEYAWANARINEMNPRAVADSYLQVFKELVASP